MVIGRRVHKFGEVVDKPSKHLLECFSGFDEAVLDLALLKNNFLEPVLCFVEGANIHGAGNNLSHQFELSVQPMIVDEQFADVVEHELKQFEDPSA